MRDPLNKTYKGDKIVASSPIAHIASAGCNNLHDNAWLLDTGVSHHMTSNASIVPHPSLYTGNEGVLPGNGNILSIHYIGQGLLSSTQSMFTCLKEYFALHKCVLIIMCS